MISRNILAAAGMIMASSAPALAATVGFGLTLSGDPNIPTFTLTNTSTAADLTSFAFTIGDTSRNFDQIYTVNTPAGSTGTLTFGDASQGGVRTDSFTISFTGLGVSQIANWRVDVDLDNLDTVENFSTVFFDNGTLPNSVVTVGFSTGDFIDFTLPDGSSLYSYSASKPVDVIPVPAALPLLAGGLGLMGLMSWRRRPVNSRA